MTFDMEKRWCTFECGIFPVRVFLFIGDSETMGITATAGMRSCFNESDAMPSAEAVSELLTQHIQDRPNDDEDGLCFSVKPRNCERVWFVRLKEFDGSIEDTAILSHECLHTALAILEYCGVSENQPYEALCYLHEAILKRFMVAAFGRLGMLQKESKGKRK